ncbi:transcription factor elt-1 [Caerostris darwini]|uniref:Transcription factor elt-1 n=1 Tax=Caerostris darwini TaxID=1538125 RepID=A0AAV4VBM4_9ARAC|nr:transcription factor elt-1 [Caerostris darwini]
MRRPIAMKKDGIQTRNRKIVSRGRKKKCSPSMEDASRTFSSRDYADCNPISQCPRPPYIDSETFFPPECSGGPFNNLQHSGYVFHTYPQAVMGAMT